MKKLVGRELSVRVIKRRRMVWPLKFKTFALSKTSWESGCLKNSRYRSTHGEDLNSSAEEAPLTAGRPGFSKLPLEDRITSGGRNGADDAGRGPGSEVSIPSGWTVPSETIGLYQGPSLSL
jgi:hypothetical protein